MKDPLHRAYRVDWSEQDQEYVGTCPEFPSLSWLSKTQVGALEGIVRLVRDIPPDARPPLFDGEPERCSLCQEPGHTHDDHWLFQHEPVKELQSRLAWAITERELSDKRLAEGARLVSEASKRIAAVRRVLDQASPKFRENSTWIDLNRALTDPEPQAATGTVTPLETLIAAARKVAAFWQVHGQLDSVQLAPLVDACRGLDDAVLNSPEFRVWNAKFSNEPLICPACGADYAEAEKSNELFQTTFKCDNPECDDACKRLHGPRFAELEVVRIKKPVAGGGGWTDDPDLPAGAVGTVVHVHEPRYEVEFTDDSGKTLRVATVLAHDLERVP